MSLRWRIALSLATVAGAVGLLTAAASYVATSSQISASIDKSLLDQATRLNDARPGGDQRARPAGHDDCPQVQTVQSATLAQFVLTDGSKRSCPAGGPELPFDKAIDVGKGPKLRTVGSGVEAYRLMTSPWHEGGYLQVARPLGEGHDILERLLAKLAALTVFGIGVAALLGWLLANRVVRPIIRLRDTAEAIASTQDLATPIPVDGTGEVGSLARSFTTMVSALAGSREQQKRLITDASHEMRTPLTSLRTNVELLEHFERLGADDRAAVLSAVQVDSKELTHLLTELVELATDQTTNTEAPEPVRLADVAHSVVERSSRRNGRTITIEDASPEALVTGRPAMLERAISNLVENAAKYSPTGHPIEVLIDGGRLSVRDHGLGIAPEDQPFVFDRFYRATLARTEPGSGLGLAIVKQIIDRHGGSVSASNHPEGGAVVGFTIPA